MSTLLAHTVPLPEGYNYLVGALFCILVALVCAVIAQGSGKNAPTHDLGNEEPSDTPRQILVIAIVILFLSSLILTTVGCVKIFSK